MIDVKQIKFKKLKIKKKPCLHPEKMTRKKDYTVSEKGRRKIIFSSLKLKRTRFNFKESK